MKFKKANLFFASFLVLAIFGVLATSYIFSDVFYCVDFWGIQCQNLGNYCTADDAWIEDVECVLYCKTNEHEWAIYCYVWPK